MRALHYFVNDEQIRRAERQYGPIDFPRNPKNYDPAIASVERLLLAPKLPSASEHGSSFSSDQANPGIYSPSSQQSSSNPLLHPGNHQPAASPRGARKGERPPSCFRASADLPTESGSIWKAARSVFERCQGGALKRESEGREGAEARVSWGEHIRLCAYRYRAGCLQFDQGHGCMSLLFSTLVICASSPSFLLPAQSRRGLSTDLDALLEPQKPLPARFPRQKDRPCLPPARPLDPLLLATFPLLLLRSPVLSQAP